MLWKKSSREIWNEQRIFFFFFFLFSPPRHFSPRLESRCCEETSSFFLNLSLSFFFLDIEEERDIYERWFKISVDTMPIKIWILFFIVIKIIREEYSNREIIFIKPIKTRYY